MEIAILVDGGYYRKRSAAVLGHKTAKERAEELYGYCNRHLKKITMEVTSATLYTESSIMTVHQLTNKSLIP